jgi:16S rRNA processing protein RimM
MDALAVGVVVSSFGISGWCKVKSFAHTHEHFARFKQIFIRVQDKMIDYTIEAVRSHNKYVVLKLSGIDTCEAVTSLVGREMWVERQYAQTLQTGEYYHKDLCQCRVYYQGKVIGRVVAVYENPAHDLLEIDCGEGKSVFIPFIKHFIGDVETDKQSIQLIEDYILQ